MSETATRHIKQQLALEKAIREELDAVVRAAAQAVVLLRPGEKGGSGMKDNQLRNVVSVARESGSVDVTTNFIRYQIGRTDGQPWRYNGFGLAVIDAIETGVVAQAAGRASQRAAAQAAGAAADLLGPAHVTLMQHYLGYLSRVFVFCENAPKKDQPWDRVARDAAGTVGAGTVGKEEQPDADA